jgi:hypothetical protein
VRLTNLEHVMSLKYWTDENSEYWTERDTCDLCGGGPAEVVMKRDLYCAGPKRAIAQQASCLGGCVGPGIVPPSRMMRHSR